MAVLGNIPFTDIYESIDICREAEELAEIKILRFEESIFYANVDNFKYQLMKYAEIDVEEAIKKIQAEKNEYAELLNDQKMIKVFFSLFLFHQQQKILTKFQKAKIHTLMQNKGIDNLAFSNQV